MVGNVLVAISSIPYTLEQTNNSTMLVSLTVGKVDAGVAVLLTEDKRLVSCDTSQTATTTPSMYPRGHGSKDRELRLPRAYLLIVPFA
jgi:hypothetical protein